jgi:hypothetical protein
MLGFFDGSCKLERISLEPTTSINFYESYAMHSVLVGRKIYIGLSRTFLHSVFNGSCYRYLCFSMLIVDVTNGIKRKGF